MKQDVQEWGDRNVILAEKIRVSDSDQKDGRQKKVMSLTGFRKDLS